MKRYLDAARYPISVIPERMKPNYRFAHLLLTAFAIALLISLVALEAARAGQDKPGSTGTTQPVLQLPGPACASGKTQDAVNNCQPVQMRIDIHTKP